MRWHKYQGDKPEDIIHAIISEAERELGTYPLTERGRQMLINPVMEVFERPGIAGLFPSDRDRGAIFHEAEGSIRKIVHSMTHDEPEEQLRWMNAGLHGPSALNVIRAFYRNFCNIPPFCLPPNGLKP